MRTPHFLLVLAAAALWGTGGLLGSLLADHSAVPAPAVAMWRILLAGVVLSAVLLVRRRLAVLSLTAPMMRRIVLTGALLAVFQVLYFTAVTMAGVGLATLVAIGSAPVWVAAWGVMRHRRAPTPRALIALAVALGGVASLLGGSLDAGVQAMAGMAVALGAGGTFAALTWVNRIGVPGLGAVRLTALSFTVGGLLLVPVVLVTGWAAPVGVAGWSYALALGVLSTAVAYIAYFAGLVTVPASVATIVVLVEPLAAAVLGAVVLGERLGPWGVAGAVALAVAVVLLRPQRDAPTRHPGQPTMVQDPNH